MVGQDRQPERERCRDDERQQEEDHRQAQQPHRKTKAASRPTQDEIQAIAPEGV